MSKTIGATFLGIIIASVTGVVYAFITELNPLIYLNCLVLIGLLFGLGYFLKKLFQYTENRNKVIRLIVGLIICFFSWYAHWCFYFVSYMEDVTFFAAFFNPVETFGFVKLFAEERVITLENSGSSGSGLEISGIFLQIVYLAEFLFFILYPLFIEVKDSKYFSEDNYCFYSSLVKYVENNEDFADAFKKASPGCYGFLSEKDMYNTINDIPLENRAKVVKLDFYYCSEGEDNSILTMTEGIFKINKKKERSFSSNKKLIKDMYVDAGTSEAILQAPR